MTKWKRIRLLGDRYGSELRKLGSYAQYDYEMAGRLEERFRVEAEAEVE